jgi:uncharacterized protein YeaO (DUF488 family)
VANVLLDRSWPRGVRKADAHVRVLVEVSGVKG